KVGGNGTESGRGERGHLMPPEVGGVGESMQQQDGRPAPLFGDGEAQAIGDDLAARQQGGRIHSGASAAGVEAAARACGSGFRTLPVGFSRGAGLRSTRFGTEYAAIRTTRRGR